MKNVFSRFILLLAALFLFSLALTACGGDESEPTPATTDDDDDGDRDEEEPTEEPVEELCTLTEKDVGHFVPLKPSPTSLQEHPMCLANLPTCVLRMAYSSQEI